ncbi:MAG: homoserine/homoserine lactone efflux protein [Candidatus Krumholzibacteriia bacterium]|jgi:homoserine/homoserine lactone efflux protein
MDMSLFLTFCGSFFLIALSPGLCMTFSLSLGISIGVRRTLWMMLGELTGIALVGVAALGGAATLLLNSPHIFSTAKLIGAAYLLWSAIRAWRSPANMSIGEGHALSNAGQLISQGFVTAISNPKAWIFLAALLPPFIDPGKPLLPQASLLLSAIIFIEFTCLLIYAQGGRVLRDYLGNRGLGQWLNRIAAGLMVCVAVWLVFG